MIVSSLDMKRIKGLDESGDDVEEKVNYVGEREIYGNVFDNLGDKNLVVVSDESYNCLRGFYDFSEYNGENYCAVCFGSLGRGMKIFEEGFGEENTLFVGNKIGKFRNISLNELLIDIENVCDVLMEFNNGRNLFVIVNLEVLENYSPGGMRVRELLYILQRMKKVKKLKGFCFIVKEQDEVLNKILMEVI